LRAAEGEVVSASPDSGLNGLLVHPSCADHADQFSQYRVIGVFGGAYETVFDVRVRFVFAVIQTG
jgi:hypothetical protein